MRIILISFLASSLLGCSSAFSTSTIRSPAMTTILRTRLALMSSTNEDLNNAASSNDDQGNDDNDDDELLIPPTISNLDMVDFVNRREILKMVGWSSAAAISAVFLPMTTTKPPAAHASGGATAGGAYLLSAKQRYNERVVKGLTAFAALGEGSDGALSMAKAKDYFASEDVGGWQDTSTAGYLLANAFRTSSATPPDRLPAVKAWKAFAKEVESMMKSIKKKESKGAAAAYTSAMGTLDAYLKEVELQL